MIFLLFQSHGTRKVTTKLLWHTIKLCIFCQSDKKIGIILMYSHQMAIVVLAVVIFLFDNLRGKRSVSLSSRELQVLNILGAHHALWHSGWNPWSTWTSHWKTRKTHSLDQAGTLLPINHRSHVSDQLSNNSLMAAVRRNTAEAPVQYPWRVMCSLSAWSLSPYNIFAGRT